MSGIWAYGTLRRNEMRPAIAGEIAASSRAVHVTYSAVLNVSPTMRARAVGRTPSTADAILMNSSGFFSCSRRPTHKSVGPPDETAWLADGGSRSVKHRG